MMPSGTLWKHLLVGWPFPGEMRKGTEVSRTRCSAGLQLKLVHNFFTFLDFLFRFYQWNLVYGKIDLYHCLPVYRNEFRISGGTSRGAGKNSFCISNMTYQQIFVCLFVWGSFELPLEMLLLIRVNMQWLPPILVETLSRDTQHPCVFLYLSSFSVSSFAVFFFVFFS